MLYLRPLLPFLAVLPFLAPTAPPSAPSPPEEIVSVPPAPFLPEEIVLYWPSGSVRVRYNIDGQGRRTGTYVEYHENGKLSLKARFKADRPSGTYQTFHDNGRRNLTAVYKNGLLHGKYEEGEYDGSVLLHGKYKDGKRDGTFDFFRGKKRVSRQEWAADRLALIDGIEPHPRSREDLWSTLDEIYDPENFWPPEPTATSRRSAPGNAETDLPAAEQRAQDADRDAALRHLMAYRSLSGLVWRDMELDPAYNYYASMAARVLVVLGRLDHTPENPGLPDGEFRDGYKGTSSSNLCIGSTLRSSIDSYMNDSDASNIDGVGHRNWCLNPKMRKTGFGIRGRFSAMWSFDGSRASPPAWQTVAYPAPGWYPVRYFGARHAWSVRLNSSQFGRPKESEVQVRIWQLDDEYLRMGEPLELDHQSIHGHLLIFRPAEIPVVAGNRFWVEISGLKGPKKTDRLEYLVEFIDREGEGGSR